MQKAYKLHPDIEGTFAGGTVIAGPDTTAVDLAAELEKGGGEIVTDDSVFQSILENFYGADGPVFEVSVVDGNKRIPVDSSNPDQQLPPQVIPDTPVLAPGETIGTQQTGDLSTEQADYHGPPATDDNVPRAEHAQGVSEYEAFSVQELKDILNERGVEYPQRLNKAQLIEVLEANDTTEGVAGNGS